LIPQNRTFRLGAMTSGTRLSVAASSSARVGLGGGFIAVLSIERAFGFAGSHAPCALECSRQFRPAALKRRRRLRRLAAAGSDQRIAHVSAETSGVHAFQLKRLPSRGQAAFARAHTSQRLCKTSLAAARASSPLASIRSTHKNIRGEARASAHTLSQAILFRSRKLAKALLAQRR
jgi:hypothetical protein